MKKLFMNWKGNLKMYLIKYNLIVHVKISWTLHKTSRKWWEFSNVFRYKLNIQISIVFLIINSEQISLKCVLKSREFRIVKIVLKKNKVGIVTCFWFPKSNNNQDLIALVKKIDKETHIVWNRVIRSTHICTIHWFSTKVPRQFNEERRPQQVLLDN